MLNIIPIIDTIYQHKDGGLYTIVNVVDYTLTNGVVTKLIEYKTLDNDTIYVRRLEHFNSSFKIHNPKEK